MHRLLLLVGVLLVIVGSPPAPSQPEHISLKQANTTQVINIAPIITKGYSISYGNISDPRISRHLYITCFLLSDNTEVDIYTQLLYHLKHERRLPMSIPIRCHNHVIASIRGQNSIFFFYEISFRKLTRDTKIAFKRSSLF